VSQDNFFSRAIPSILELVQQNFAIRPVEIEIPRGVREHLAFGTKPQNTRTPLVAIYYPALGSRQDSAGNVLIEQYAIALSPQLRVFVNGQRSPALVVLKTESATSNVASTRFLGILPGLQSSIDPSPNVLRVGKDRLYP
jgi:CHAT domain-containing protein